MEEKTPMSPFGFSSGKRLLLVCFLLVVMNNIQSLKGTIELFVALQARSLSTEIVARM